jgi:16S rRNA (uracil1498-N3)-methyltransferase
MQDPDECRHLTRVLRKRPGDPVTFVDGKGWIYRGVIERLEPSVVHIGSVTRRPDDTGSGVRVTLAPALLKGPRLDGVVEKATELGVAGIMPMRTARTVVDRTTAGRDYRRERWQRIALSAMKQSLRARLPCITPVSDFDTVIRQAGGYDFALIAWEEEEQAGLKAIVAGRPLPSTVLVMVGPEGGFTAGEMVLAREANVHPVSLGRRRFRADTACIVMITLLMSALGELNP